MSTGPASLRRAAQVGLAAALLLTLGAVAARRAASPAGFERTLRGTAGSVTRVAPAVDVRDLRDAARRSGVPVRGTWRGTWTVREAGRHRLVVDSDTQVVVAVDGVPLLETRGARARAEVGLAAGPHELEIVATARRMPRRLLLAFVDPGGDRHAFEGGRVFPAPPRAGQLAAAGAARLLSPLAGLAWLVALGLGAWHVLRLPETATLRRVAKVAVPLVVVLYGGALRFEALVGRYWHAAPPAALALERAISEARPPGLRWEPSPPHVRGDPRTYFKRARRMESFYEGHVREPLFPWTARQMRRFFGDDAVIVDAASALFSTLGVAAAFLLGAAASGWGVGVGAAALMAVEEDLVWWGVEGFRDDAFMAFTALAAAALLRLRERPALPWAVLAGLAAGAACLSRLSALSFVVPALVWLALPKDALARGRRLMLGVALLVTLVVVGPYLATCAITYGDPFYAVNHHTRFYRSRSGAASDREMSVSAWLGGSYRAGELLLTGAEGVTTYPFRVKWRGFDHLSIAFKRGLRLLAAAGTVALAFTARGRFLLVVLVSALLPFAFTWKIPGGSEWRFTMVAYPFYLVGALALLPSLRNAVRRYGSDRLPWRGTAPCPPPG